MEILVNRRPVTSLNPKVLKYLAKGRPADLVTGTVMSGEEASAAFLKSTRILMTFVSLAVGALVVGHEVWAASSASKTEQGLGLVVGIPALLIAIVVLRWIYLRRMRLWAEQLPARITSAAPAGTIVRLDADGVTIDAETAFWANLRIAEIELNVQGGGEDATLVVERMVLAGGHSPITLDASMITNGKQMVVAACQRLLPKEL